jgi:hypothetical protein
VAFADVTAKFAHGYSWTGESGVIPPTLNFTISGRLVGHANGWTLGATSKVEGSIDMPNLNMTKSVTNYDDVPDSGIVTITFGEEDRGAGITKIPTGTVKANTNASMTDSWPWSMDADAYSSVTFGAATP